MKWSRPNTGLNNESETEDRVQRDINQGQRIMNGDLESEEWENSNGR
jgi:hypothetical protein